MFLPKGFLIIAIGLLRRPSLMGLLLIVPAKLASQSCAGTAAFTETIARVGVGVGVSDGTRSFGADVALGAATGLFGAASVGTIDYDDFEDGGTTFGIEAGYGVPLVPARTVEFCPVIGFGLVSGPDFYVGQDLIEVSGRAFSVGGNLGGAVQATQSLQFVPALGAFAVFEKGTFSSGTESISNSEEYFTLSPSIGLVLNRVATVRVHGSFFLGVEGGSDPVFGLGIAYNFGRRP